MASIEHASAPVEFGHDRDLRAHLSLEGPFWATLVRLAAVFIPVGAVLQISGSDGSLILAAVASTVWFIALGHEFNSTRVSPLALGIPLTSAMATLKGLAVISITVFWLPDVSISPAQLLIMAAGVFVSSALCERARGKHASSVRRLLLVGPPQAEEELTDELAGHPAPPFELVGAVYCDAAGSLSTSDPTGCAAVRSALEQSRPDLVVVDEPARDVVLEALLDGGSLDVRVVGLHDFYAHAFGRVPVRGLAPTWFMSILHLYQRPYSRIAKRVFDVALAAVCLLLAAPVLAAAALLVRLSGPGAILYRQVRLGEGGRHFEVIKFRTMVPNAEGLNGAVWASENDPRVTRAGKVLRRTRIDELPQLWNVLRGTMSIVGPRPERPEFVELLRREVPFWTRRHLVKPGITGWAQVRCGYAADVNATAEKVSYDLYYLKNQSIALDLAIAAKTALVVLGRIGAR